MGRFGPACGWNGFAGVPVVQHLRLVRQSDDAWDGIESADNDDAGDGIAWYAK